MYTLTSALLLLPVLVIASLLDTDFTPLDVVKAHQQISRSDHHQRYLRIREWLPSRFSLDLIVPRQHRKITPLPLHPSPPTRLLQMRADIQYQGRGLRF